MINLSKKQRREKRREKMISKKRIALLVTLIMALTMGLAGCGGGSGDESGNDVAGNDQVYEMKISHLTTEIDPLHIGYVYLKELLDERTDGRIKVTIYGNKQLANSDREQAEMVQQGLAELGTTPAFTVAALNADLKEWFIYDYPYLMPNSETLYSFTDGPIGDEMRAEAEEKLGVRVYPRFHIGWVKISSNKSPIVDPAALAGLKIRTTSSEMYIAFVKALGANPTPVNYGELFTALQQGTVDGMMTTTSLYQSDRFYEVQDYMGSVDPFTIFHIPLVNGDWYNSLPDDLKVIFDECMVEYIDKMRELEDEKELTAKEFLASDGGMVVTEYTAEQKQKFVDIGLQVVQENASIAGEDFVKRVQESLSK